MLAKPGNPTVIMVYYDSPSKVPIMPHPGVPRDFRLLTGYGSVRQDGEHYLLSTSAKYGTLCRQTDQDVSFYGPDSGYKKGDCASAGYSNKKMIHGWEFYSKK